MTAGGNEEPWVMAGNRSQGRLLIITEHLLGTSHCDKHVTSHLILQQLCETDIALIAILRVWKLRFREFTLSDLP